MLFTSFGFILFLAILFPLYYLVPRRFQWMLLLAAIYVFYTFAGWGCLIFIAVTTATCWYAALRMDRLQKRQNAHLVLLDLRFLYVFLFHSRSYPGLISPVLSLTPADTSAAQTQKRRLLTGKDTGPQTGISYDIMLKIYCQLLYRPFFDGFYIILSCAVSSSEGAVGSMAATQRWMGSPSA